MQATGDTRSVDEHLAGLLQSVSTKSLCTDSTPSTISICAHGTCAGLFLHGRDDICLEASCGPDTDCVVNRTACTMVNGTDG